jgi:hypothetical protein
MVVRLEVHMEKYSCMVEYVIANRGRTFTVLTLLHCIMQGHGAFD